MNEQLRTAPRPALWTRDFVKVMISNFLLFSTVQMLIPTLPVHIKAIGESDFSVGVIISVFALATVTSRPFIGKALDARDRRTLYLVGLAFFCLSVLGYYWMWSATSAAITRIVHGVGWAIIATTNATLIADLVPQARRGEGTGYYGMASTLAMAAGPLVGVSVLQQFGFDYILLVSAILILLAAVLSQTVSFTRGASAAAASESGNLRSGLLERSAFLPSALVLLFGLTYGGVSAFITLFGIEAGIDNVGIFFLVNAVTALAVRPVAGRVFDTKRHPWILIPGGASVALAIFLLPFSESLPLLAISAFFYGIGFGSLQPALLAWVLNTVPASRRGKANATFFSAFELGLGGEAVFTGLAAHFTSYASAYHMSMVFMLAYFGIYARHLTRSGKEPKAQAVR